MSGGASSGDAPRLEAWVVVAFALMLACVLGFFYLGMRTGGAGPIWYYSYGRFALAAGALLVLPVALLLSARRPPLLTRRRGWAFACLAGTIGFATWPLPYPTPYPQSAAAIGMPVAGRWRVLLGGGGQYANPLRMLPARCTALHLVQEEGGSPLVADAPASPTHVDHRAFAQQVLAPCDGVVVRAVGEVPDRPHTERRGAPDLGNHLVLELATGEFLYLSCLQQGSLQVAPGDAVSAGQPLARVGASARNHPTLVPHLEVFLASAPDLARAEGIPWTLNDIRVDGVLMRDHAPSGGVTRDGAWVGQVLEASP